MRKRSKFFYSVIFTLTVLGLGVACASWYIADCQTRELVPSVPVYPGSTFLSEDSVGLNSWTRPRVTRNYLSSAPPQKVASYYDTFAACQDYPAAFLCNGSIPNGIYYAQIYRDTTISDGQTHYSLEIRWTTCRGLFE